MEASMPGSAAPRLVSAAHLLSVLGFAATVSALALRWHLSVPYNDDWRLLDDRVRTPLGSWLFSVQNGHRMPATLLWGVTFQSPEVAWRVAERLSRERRSPFGDERSGLAGAPFAERFLQAGADACGGAPGEPELRAGRPAT